MLCHQPSGCQLTCRGVQVQLEGIVRSSEKPSQFVPANEPGVGRWFWVDAPALAAACKLPPDTPLVEVRLLIGCHAVIGLVGSRVCQRGVLTLASHCASCLLTGPPLRCAPHTPMLTCVQQA